ncbi:hypothetical protein EMIHUDRAFT_213544 [Emiliania huxleyi CCMP1516]|uniref:F-box domain-containing protein n=2 Tax=Emiliania huxleyi TaxID=2903 RepID=A0A0D3IM54_EMIH1|nr:hypothetical protein EMIHUDRAFT_213544 [Emiliania huxleyi CCMP1516]EOD12339.1 hypothetical protein EMIHUDRAFT_213544 [Emiliania huxleyi CCMP1516]|eukprot:XP_005764768.1 hypothetical protein EMIHUDRAFT_213544 [Emiliania huxleyi CCMP1516]
MAAPRLCTGTPVSLRGLTARPELNGLEGRVLRYDAASGRYGIRAAASQKLLAIKRENLTPATVASGPPAEGGVTHLLHLPSDELDLLLHHLSAQSLSRLAACSATLNAAVLACGTGDIGKFGNAQRLLPYDRFVRSVSVDWTSQPVTIAVGLSSGAVACASMYKSGEAPGENPFERFRLAANAGAEVQSLRGAVHEEQVLAVALHARSRLVVSGDGHPSYPTAYEPYPYAPTVKVWRLGPAPAAVAADGAAEPIRSDAAIDTRDGELLHTLAGHEGAILKVVLLGGSEGAAPTHAASAGEDRTLRIWDVVAGREVRALGRRTSPVIGLVALSDGELISVSSAGELALWRWETGQSITAATLPFRDPSCSVACVSYHAPTATLAYGVDQHRASSGLICLVRLGSSFRSGSVGKPILEQGFGSEEDAQVICVQHDADKVVAVTRSEEGEGPQLSLCSPSVERYVRFFVSSVAYNHESLVHDGLDHRVGLNFVE